MNYFPVRVGTIFVELIMQQGKNSSKQNANKLCSYQQFQTGNKCLEGIYWHLWGLLYDYQHEITKWVQ